MKKYNILDEQNTPERILQEDLARDTRQTKFYVRKQDLYRKRQYLESKMQKDAI